MAFKGDLEALVLGVLQGGSLHGYEIAKRIREVSETALSVGEGQLYPALHRLELEEYIESEWIPQEGKPSRKVYCLTQKGGDFLQEKQKAWEAFAKGVGSILSSVPKPTTSKRTALVQRVRFKALGGR